MIKKGDLVMVVKPSPCCDRPEKMGLVFEARGIHDCIIECLLCGEEREGVGVELENDKGFPIERLMKIDPPATGDTIPTRKEVKNEMETD